MADTLEILRAEVAALREALMIANAGCDGRDESIAALREERDNAERQTADWQRIAQEIETEYLAELREARALLAEHEKVTTRGADPLWEAKYKSWVARVRAFLAGSRDEGPRVQFAGVEHLGPGTGVRDEARRLGPGPRKRGEVCEAHRVVMLGDGDSCGVCERDEARRVDVYCLHGEDPDPGCPQCKPPRDEARGAPECTCDQYVPNRNWDGDHYKECPTRGGTGVPARAAPTEPARDEARHVCDPDTGCPATGCARDEGPRAVQGALGCQCPPEAVRVYGEHALTCPVYINARDEARGAAEDED